MTDAALTAYLIGAVWRAMAITAVLLGAAHIAGARSSLRLAAALSLAAFMAMLALHPFPDPSEFVCGPKTPAPQLTPLSFVWRAAELVDANASLRTWLRDLTVATAAVNLLIFAGLGWLVFGLLPPQHAASRRMRLTVLAGACFSLGLELAQLTGLFGVYPCAYRTFDVDDLLLNTLGAWLGSSIARHRSARDGA